VLGDDYGIRPEEMHWRIGGVDQPEDFDYVAVNIPTVDIAPIAPGDHLARLLVDSEIDAIVSYQDPQILRDGHPAIRRLFRDPGAVERDYHARTGVFPIMHLVGLRRELAESCPWLPRSLMKAFTAAKDRWLSRYTDLDAPAVALPWLTEHAREAIDRMGPDFWPYGVEPNRKTLETQARWSHEQGLPPDRLAVEDLFAEQTRTWYRPD